MPNWLFVDLNDLLSTAIGIALVWGAFTWWERRKGRKR